MAKSLLNSSRITIGKNTYVAGKRIKKYKVVEGTIKPQKALLIKKKTINHIRKNKNTIAANEKNKTIEKTTNRKNDKTDGIMRQSLKSAANTFKNNVDAQNDRSADMLSTAIKTGENSVKVFKVAQTVSPAIIKTAKGVYKTGETTIRVINTVDRTIGKVQLGHIKLNAETMHDFRKFALDKAKQIRAVKNTLKKVKHIKNSVSEIKHKIKTAKKNIKTAVNYIRAIQTGTVKIKIKKENLISAALFAHKTVKKTVNTASNIKSKTKILKKPLNSASNVLENSLSNSNDTGTQALSTGIKTARNAPGIIRTAGKITSKTVKGQIKTVKGSVKAVKTLKTHGVKGSSKILRNKISRGIANAGKSVVSALMGALKNAALKLLLPVIVIVVAVVILINAVSAPINVISSMFGGIFTFFFGDGSEAANYFCENNLLPSLTIEVDIEQYISEKIEEKCTELTESIKDTAVTNLAPNGSYHSVRLIYSDETYELTAATDLNGILPLDELANIVHPIFNTLVLERHVLTPSEVQAENIINEIWNKLVSTAVSDLPTEYCGDSHNCGIIHADGSCPHFESGTHTEYACSSCDSYVYSCNSHGGSHSFSSCYSLSCTTAHTHTSACYGLTCSSYFRPEGEVSHTYYHTTAEQAASGENKRLLCNGYRKCGGHYILAVNVIIENRDKLLNVYFLNRIGELEEMETRNEEQENELFVLKDNYDIVPCTNSLRRISTKFLSKCWKANMKGIIMKKIKKLLLLLITLVLVTLTLSIKTNAAEVKPFTIAGKINVLNPDSLNQKFVAVFTNLLNEDEKYEFLYDPSDNTESKQFFLAGNSVFRIEINFSDKWTENDYEVINLDGTELNVITVKEATFEFNWLLRCKSVVQTTEQKTETEQTVVPETVENIETTPVINPDTETTQNLVKEQPKGILEVFINHIWSFVLILVVCVASRSKKIIGFIKNKRR